MLAVSGIKREDYENDLHGRPSVTSKSGIHQTDLEVSDTQVHDTLAPDTLLQDTLAQWRQRREIFLSMSNESTANLHLDENKTGETCLLKDLQLTPKRHPEDVLVVLMTKPNDRSFVVVVIELVAGSVYTLQVLVSQKSRVVLQELTQVQVSTQKLGNIYEVEVLLPPDTEGIHDIVVTLYDSFPGLDRGEDFLTKRTWVHDFAQPELSCLDQAELGFLQRLPSSDLFELGELVGVDSVDRKISVVNSAEWDSVVIEGVRCVKRDLAPLVQEALRELGYRNCAQYALGMLYKRNTIPLGLKWKEVDLAKQKLGIEITNENLAEALQYQNHFSQEEWDDFNLSSFSFGLDHYVKVGETNFEPDVAPTYDLDNMNRNDTLYQYDVYNMAANIAIEKNKSWVIDLGCGSGKKAHKLWKSGFNVVAVDFGDNYRAALKRFEFDEEMSKKKHPYLVLEIDLDSVTWITIQQLLPDNIMEDAVVVAADVIEHMLHPEKLIQIVRSLVERGAAAAVISTPDSTTSFLQNAFWRDNPLGPPPRAQDVQIWSRQQFSTFLQCEGVLDAIIMVRMENARDVVASGVMAIIGSSVPIASPYKIEEPSQQVVPHLIKSTRMLDISSDINSAEEFDDAETIAHRKVFLSLPNVSSRSTANRTKVPFFIYDDPALVNEESCRGSYTRREGTSPGEENMLSTAYDDFYFLQQMRTHPWRTFDATQAKLYVVPFLPALCKCDKKSSCPERFAKALHVIQDKPYFQKNKGRDHLIFAFDWVFSVWGSAAGVPVAWWQILNNTIATRYEYYMRSIYDQKIFKPWLPSQKPTSLWEMQWERTRQTVVLPYAPTVSMDYFVQAQFSEWMQRKYVIFYHTRSSGSGHNATVLRHAPLHNISAWHKCSIGNDLPPQVWREHFRQSKFALVIRGDTPSSHAFTNALFFGCIPVVISDAFRIVSPTYDLNAPFLKLDDFAILIAEEEFLRDPLHILQQLQKIPEIDIQQKLVALKKAQEYFVVGHPHGQVVSLILQSAHQSATKQIERCDRFRRTSRLDSSSSSSSSTLSSFWCSVWWCEHCVSQVLFFWIF